jgi:putative ABC transport system permease protein
LQETLKQTGTSTTQNRRGRLLARGLVVAEVALAVVLLSCAGLMVQSVVRLLKVDVGFRHDNLLRIYVRPPFYNNPFEYKEQHTAFMNNIHEHIVSLPGVTSAGIWIDTWLGGDYTVIGEDRNVQVGRIDCGLEDKNPLVAIGVPLLEGRFLNRMDLRRNTIVVNKALADIVGLEKSAVGKSIRSLPEPGWDKEEFEIVGVVGNTRINAYEHDPAPTFFRPSEEQPNSQHPHSFFVRTQIEPAAMIRPIQLAIKEAEPDMIAPGILIISEELYNTTQGRRTFTFYLMLSAAVGLALAAIGLYGILAYTVMRRTREMGIRMALGAQRKDVFKLIIEKGLVMIVVGLVIGVAGALALTRVLTSFLYSVTPTDPMTFVAVSLLLMVVGLVACYIPARRATKIDPMSALRYE